MGFINTVIDAFFEQLKNRHKAKTKKSKFRIGDQIYFMRYDIIHCGFVNHIDFDVKQETFTYETDLVDVLAESDTEDFMNLTVAEEDAFETMDELIEHLKGNQIVSLFL